MRCVYIRNCYKTAGTYGKKEISIDSERFIQSIKKVKNFDVFPITDDPNKIGYYIVPEVQLQPARRVELAEDNHQSLQGPNHQTEGNLDEPRNRLEHTPY